MLSTNENQFNSHASRCKTVADIPSGKSTVVFSGSGLLPATTLKVDYFYLNGLLERVYLLHQARCFRREQINVTLHDGRRFEWDRELALQCFTRRIPKYNKLMALVPQPGTEWK